MKAVVYIILLMTFALSEVKAQETPKIVMHLQTADTLVYKSLVNQITNMKKEIPDAQVAVVCHGPGMNFLLKTNAEYVSKIEKLKLKDVTFIGCQFTMKQKNIKPEDLVPFTQTVPYAMVDIVKKQQDGWIYVKLGF
ncbi:MAG: DsrE family protein [Cyclobacteriaceae bacterium]|nr:MAG: DsrE family protein [Cyclobacteriaceae bacterium]